MRRVVHALRCATPPTTGVLVVSTLIFVMRWPKLAENPISALAIFAGLDLVVFLTYFVLALTGFKASPAGDVNVPRVYVWSLVCAVAVLVFGVLFALLEHRK